MSELYLPRAEPHSPSCGACGTETWHDGERLRCDNCLLRFDSGTLEAEYLDPDAQPCGVPCPNEWHGPARIRVGLSYNCKPCALPEGHHNGSPTRTDHYCPCEETATSPERLNA